MTEEGRLCGCPSFKGINNKRKEMKREKKEKIDDDDDDDDDDVDNNNNRVFQSCYCYMNSYYFKKSQIGSYYYCESTLLLDSRIEMYS